MGVEGTFYTKKWRMFLLALLVAISILWAFSPWKIVIAYELQERIEKEINDAIRDGKEIHLEKSGDIQWDYICFVSYEASGIDVSDGLYVAQRGLDREKLDFSDFSIANDYYNELSTDWMYGLVFVNLPQKLLVAISFNDVVKASVLGDGCSKANNALLLNTMKEARGYRLTFKGKMP